MPDDLICPIPRALTHEDARAKYVQVRKEMRGATDSAIRREAARRLNTDYDTFLKAWKKPVTTPPAPGPLKPDMTVKKKTVSPFNIDYYSSNIKSTAKTAREVSQNGKVIGHLQQATQGYWEMDGRIRTGRFITEKRGWIALDENGQVLKNGFQVVMREQADAEKFLVRRAEAKALTHPDPIPVTPKPKPTIETKPPEVPTLTHETARQQAKLVKKEFPSWTDAQVRREAAKRMNTDYDTYLRAWKKPVGKDAQKPFASQEPVVAPRPDTKKPLWKTKAETPRDPAPLTRMSDFYGDIWYKGGDREFARVVKFRGRLPGEADIYQVRFSQASRGEFKFKSLDEASAFIRKVDKEGYPDHLMVNPGRGVVNGATKNCTSCATTYELRRRGYDVVARLMPKGQPLQDVFSSWGIKGKNMIGGDYGDTLYPVANYTTLAKWNVEMLKLPNGARGFLNVEWERGGAHILNWEKRDGKIWYIDGQIAEESSPYSRWAFAKTDRIWVARVDDLPDPPAADWLTGNADVGQKKTKNPYGDF